VRAGMSKLLSLQATWADFELMFISYGKEGLRDIRDVCVHVSIPVVSSYVSVCVPLC